MKAEERTITSILTEERCYEIPPYQRPYSWDTENVTQLLEDIWEAYSANDTEYFIGSLITIEHQRDELYEVVDGQQRLTTLNVILAKLRSIIENASVQADLEKRILPRNVYTNKTQNPRLSLRSKDQNFFRKHILEAQEVSEDSRKKLDEPKLHLLENSDVVEAFFKDKTQEETCLFTDYLLRKVYVVFVSTDSWKSAYRLFNVLNARGLSLSNADLIKNSLFSRLTQNDRSPDLETNWIELEEEIGIDKLDLFFSHHLTTLNAARAKGTLHEEMEKHICTDPFVFVAGILTSAKNYTRIVELDFEEEETRRALRSLRRVAHNEWIPPLLAYLNKSVPELSVEEFIILLEKVTFQNWVRRLSRSARLTIYFKVISKINTGCTADEIREIIKNDANNNEFFSLLDSTVYGKPFDRAVLMRLEEAIQDNSVSKSYSGQITIEHVLPQALKDEYWKEHFDELSHEEWIHKLGNLTLLSGRKNYRAQYYSFDRKKKIYNERNNKVSFDLTKEICEVDDWHLPVLEERHNKLMELSREIWTIN